MPRFSMLCVITQDTMLTRMPKSEIIPQGLNTKLKECLNLVRADSYNELINMAITQEDCILAHPAEKKRKTPLDLLVLRRRGLVLCKILYPQPLRKPLSKGVGFSNLHSSKATFDLLLHSRVAQGRMLYRRSVQMTGIVVSIVEV